MILNYFKKYYLEYILKAFFVIAIVYSVMMFFQDGKHFTFAFKTILFDLIHNKIKVFFLMLLFMLINWFLESLKWKRLIDVIEDISFLRSFKVVLVGMSYGIATPRNVGDFIGRISMLKPENRYDGVGALMMSRIFQMIPTLLFGVIGGLVYFFNNLIPLDFNFYVIFIVCCILSILIFSFLIYKSFILKFLKRKIKYSILRFVIVWEKYQNKDFLYLLNISMLRYFTFIIQFMIIYITLEPQVNVFLLVCGISLILLFKSIIPSFNFLNDLGTRELGALMFLSLIHMQNDVIIIGSLIVWFVNIFIPMCLGGIVSLFVSWKRG